MRSLQYAGLVRVPDGGGPEVMGLWPAVTFSAALCSTVEPLDSNMPFNLWRRCIFQVKNIESILVVILILLSNKKACIIDAC